MAKLPQPTADQGKEAFDRLPPEARCQVQAIIEDQVKTMPEFMKEVQANAYAIANDAKAINEDYTQGRRAGRIKGICS